jgi:hypothetical protein
VVDMEYVHRYESRSVSFETSYDIEGPPKGSDLPGAHIADSFDRRWKPWIGVTFNDLIVQPPAVLWAKRVMFVCTRRVPRLAVVMLRDGIRVLRDVIIGCIRRFVLRRYPEYLLL